MNILSHLRPVYLDFLRCSKGSTAIEYALIASVVSIAILGGVESLSGGISSLFNAIASAIE